MKKIILALIVLCSVVACAIIYSSRQKTAPLIVAPVAEASPDEMTTQPQSEKVAVVSQDSPPANAGYPEQTSPAVPVVNEATPDDSANPIHKAVDALLAAKSAGEKHALFQQLVKSGEIDAAIAELKQRATDNPTDAKIPTTLGEAQLNKVRAIKEAGGDVNDMGILAMEADKSFNAALKIDPQNWEANFVKASTQFYWPPDEKRDNDAAQRLAGLIDQQETMTPNPAFVQTYVALGNQYEKMGQHDKAVATWQLGLQKFPNDPGLTKKVSGQ